MNSKVLSAVLTHQNSKDVDVLLRWWSDYVALNDLLIVYTGSQAAFHELSHRLKLHVVDQRLQTSDHQRELQSYTSVFRAVAQSLRAGDWGYVNFCEYDQLPLRRDADRERIRRLDETGADVLAYQLRRVDETNHPHWLYYQTHFPHDEIIGEISHRSDISVVLSMFGSGSFWKRQAFENVAALKEPTPIYLELWLPTVAHHLGYRVVGVDEQQEQWMLASSDRSEDIETARKSGAWSIHPVKSVPTRDP